MRVTPIGHEHTLKPRGLYAYHTYLLTKFYNSYYLNLHLSFYRLPMT